jgi:hypothetical protein
MNIGLSLVETDATGYICSWTRRILFEQGSTGSPKEVMDLAIHITIPDGPRENLSGPGCIFRIPHPVYDPGGTFRIFLFRWFRASSVDVGGHKPYQGAGCSGELTAESKVMLPRVCGLCRVMSTVATVRLDQNRDTGHLG